MKAEACRRQTAVEVMWRGSCNPGQSPNYIPIITRESRMLRASLPSSGRLSVCLSVRLSVTLMSCIKTVQAKITKSLLWAAPRSSLS